MRKKFHYISPSIIPSKTANSIHVINQCVALCHREFDVYLYSKRSVQDKKELKAKVKSVYGVSHSNLKHISYFSKMNFGINFFIALIAVKNCLFSGKNYILSRNLYAAFILAVIFRYPILYETHQLEFGFRKILQRFVLSCRIVKTIVISNKLAEFLSWHHNMEIKNPLILHDAAPSGIKPVKFTKKRNILSQELTEDLRNWHKVIGYFGHLYAGRGIEIIEKLAIAFPDCLFLIYGGNEQDVLFYKKKIKLKNLIFMGYIGHKQSLKIMKLVDVLLMPYQHKVAIGMKYYDTAKWMSPMKMFEYMASGIPFISSDLPVLREVLCDGVNSLLVEAHKSEAWIRALGRLINDPRLSEKLALQAYYDYKNHHTWLRRADKLITAIKQV